MKRTTLADESQTGDKKTIHSLSVWTQCVDVEGGGARATIEGQ